EVLGDEIKMRGLDLALAEEEIVGGDGARECVVDAVEAAAAQAGEVDGGLAEGLAGEGAAADGAAGGALLDDGDALPEVSGLGGAFFAGGAGADHDQVKVFDGHPSSPWLQAQDSSVTVIGRFHEELTVVN